MSATIPEIFLKRASHCRRAFGISQNLLPVRCTSLAAQVSRPTPRSAVNFNALLWESGPAYINASSAAPHEQHLGGHDRNELEVRVERQIGHAHHRARN